MDFSFSYFSYIYYISIGIIMSKLKSTKYLSFKPEDFSYGLPKTDIDLEEAAQNAQARFDAWLSEQVRVHWSKRKLEDSDVYLCSTEVESGDDMTALLVCIEELPKKPCEHRPFVGYDSRFGMTLGSIPECKDCGVKLKMPTKWEVSE